MLVREPCAPGVYLGKIGERYPITLVIEGIARDGQAARAWYFYDKQDKAIKLESSLGEDGRLFLAENGARFEPSTTPNGGLAGDWTQEGKPPQKVDLR